MTEDVKRGRKRRKKPAWLDAGGVESWNVKLGCDVCFWAFHLSSPLSALSLELGLFIRGWGGSWIPQCEIGRDANPDRLVIKKPSERKKTLSRRRVGGVGKRWSSIAHNKHCRLVMRSHAMWSRGTFDPNILFSPRSSTGSCFRFDPQRADFTYKCHSVGVDLWL